MSYAEGQIWLLECEVLLEGCCALHKPGRREEVITAVGLLFQFSSPSFGTGDIMTLSCKER